MTTSKNPKKFPELELVDIHKLSEEELRELYRPLNHGEPLRLGDVYLAKTGPEKVLPEVITDSKRFDRITMRQIWRIHGIEI